MSSSALDFHQTTIQAFVAQLQPRAWNRAVPAPEDIAQGDPLSDWELFNGRWDLRRFFDWPPDVFLMTSLLLHRTGAYRAGVTPPKGELWPDARWPEECRAQALAWRHWLCESSRLGHRVEPHPLERYIEQIQACYKIPINDLHNVEIVLGDRRELKLDARIWDLCRSLMELHAIADETMRGVGTLFAPHVSLFSHEKSPAPRHIERIHLQANLLLALRGTLSRIGKHRGIVLPKSRTPQSGVTLRSLSLHLSFHHTEVDIAWRAVPWTNMDENTLNMLLVPWPYRVSARAFAPEMGPDTSQRVGSAGFFAYDPHQGDDGDGRPFDPADIVARVLASEREAKRVHFLVFPEAALRPGDLDRLKDALEDKIHPSRMPLIIAGLTGREEGDSYNRVVLSIYYAQRWFDMVQDKHHRWKLDPEQIASYSLGGTLSGARSWWESIRIPRRRLSFVTSNSWLTLAPLICEDLARLEPISDLIRGVGPTLLIALLLDGPQLTTRWPARYAGVLADDPGTSVLTLTSLGMCQRSIPARIPTREEAVVMRAQHGSSVALWNDQFWRWHQIKITPEDRAALLTVATQWIQEDTFDMRAEAENSAVFAFQSIHVPRLKPADPPPAPAANGAPANGAAEPPREARTRPQGMETALADMNELSLYTFYVDALVDTPPGGEQELLRWMYSAIGLLDVDAVLRDRAADGSDRELLALLRWSLWHRKGNPATIPTAHLFLALHIVTRLVTRANRGLEYADDPDRPEWGWGLRWERLVCTAEEDIEKCRQRMREDVAASMDRAGPETPAPRPGTFSMLLAALSNHFEDFAETAHKNVEDRETPQPKSLPPLKPRDAGRIVFSAPLSVLWAVHNRLSVRRRTRTLLLEEAKLLMRIESILESDLHEDFREWKKAMGYSRG